MCIHQKVGNVEKRCVEKDQRLRDVTEELRVAKVSLSTREGTRIINYHVVINSLFMLQWN